MAGGSSWAWGLKTPTFRLLRRVLDCCAMIKIIIPGCYLVCIAKVQSIFPGRDDEDPPNRCQNKIIPKMRNIAACARPSKAGETSFGGDGSSWAWGLKTPTFRLLRRVWNIGYRRVFEEGVGYRVIVCRSWWILRI